MRTLRRMWFCDFLGRHNFHHIPSVSDWCFCWNCNYEEKWNASTQTWCIVP